MKLDQVNRAFAIGRKIVLTTTDNGANCVAANPKEASKSIRKGCMRKQERSSAARGARQLSRQRPTRRIMRKTAEAEEPKTKTRGDVNTVIWK